MNVLPMATIRSLGGRTRRMHVMIFFVGLCMASAGGGFAWAKAGWFNEKIAVVQRTTVPEAVRPSSLPQAAQFALVSPEILAAFRTGSRAGASGYRYAPTELPTDCRVVVRALQSVDAGGSERSGPSVMLAVGEGYLAFYDGMTNDLENLPGTRCGSVDGHPATVYHVLGGDLVQWQSEGLTHGVFAYGVPRTVVLQVVAGMRRVDDGAQEALSDAPDLLHSSSRNAGVVSESLRD